MESHEASDIDPRELHVMSAIREVAAATRAPATLRTRIETDWARSRSVGRARTVYAAGLATAVAAGVAVVLLLLPGGAPGAPSVAAAAALAVRGSTSSAPASDPRAPATWLDQRVGRLYFPNWSWRFGWTAIGQRTDRIAGRRVVTVYYQSRVTTIAYTIVGGSALPRPKAPVAIWNGLKLRLLSIDGRLAVTWRRGGRTCVLSGMGVTASELERLAAWR